MKEVLPPDKEKHVLRRMSDYSKTGVGLGMYDPQFKDLTSEIWHYLEKLKVKLDTADSDYESKGKTERKQCGLELLERIEQTASDFLDDAFQRMDVIVRNFSLAEHQIHRISFRQHLHKYFLMAPFIRRAYTKPLGLPGDYIMMNMLYDDHDTGDTLFARLINRYSCRVAAARAVIGRVSYLSKKIKATIERVSKKGDDVLFTSVGSGPVKEILELVRSSQRGDQCHVHLVDMVQESLLYCQSCIHDLKELTGSKIKVEYLNRTVQKLIREKSVLSHLQGQDLIYCIGLFDYLPFHIAKEVVKGLYDLLSDEGELIIGNFSEGNRSRYFMEYAADWSVIHRSNEEMIRMTRGICPLSKVEVHVDESGVQLYLCMKK